MRARDPRSSPLLPLVALAAALGCASTSSQDTTTVAPSATPVTPSGERADADRSRDARRADQTRTPTESERRAIDELLRRAEQLRGLRFQSEVPVEVQAAAQISRQLTEQLEPEDLQQARQVYGALGLIEPDMDLREMMGRLVAEQVVGFYDPDEGRLVVRDDVMRAMRPGDEGGDGRLAEARVVLVHELVHALQDQRLDLGTLYDRERDTDADNAFRAIVEGDATLSMMGYVAERQGGRLELITQAPELLRGLVSNTEALPGAELGSAPAIVRVTLVSAYMHGMVFAAELHKRGGWSAVNRVYENLPQSTEQVLHPARYFASEQPEEVTIPELGALQQAGWEQVTEDTLGELEMSVYLAQGTGEDTDREAAAGWGGDRLRVYHDGDGGTAAVWWTRWDDAQQAKEAARAARRVGRQTLSGRAAERHQVVRHARRVLLIRGLPAKLHSHVRTAFALDDVKSPGRNEAGQAP